MGLRGDVKFLLTIGAFVGPSQVFFSTLYGLVILGITTIIYLLIRKKMGQLFASVVIAPMAVKTLMQKKDRKLLSGFP